MAHLFVVVVEVIKQYLADQCAGTIVWQDCFVTEGSNGKLPFICDLCISGFLVQQNGHRCCIHEQWHVAMTKSSEFNYGYVVAVL
jgi:hypothetical protein